MRLWLPPDPDAADAPALTQALYDQQSKGAVQTILNFFNNILAPADAQLRILKAFRPYAEYVACFPEGEDWFWEGAPLLSRQISVTSRYVRDTSYPGRKRFCKP
jgi:hypothetical protein